MINRQPMWITMPTINLVAILPSPARVMSTSLNPIFSSDAKNILICTPDNRVKLWDVDSKKETRNYVERRHLSHTYTCWARSHASKGELGLCAAGTSDGSIIVWDLSRGVVLKEIEVSGETPSDLAFSKDSKTLYIAASMNKIDLYDISSGELRGGLKAGKKAVSRLCLNPKADVIAVGRWEKKSFYVYALDLY